MYYNMVPLAAVPYAPPPHVTPFAQQTLQQQRLEEWADFEDELESMRTHPGPFQDTRI